MNAAAFRTSTDGLSDKLNPAAPPPMLLEGPSAAIDDVLLVLRQHEIIVSNLGHAPLTFPDER